MLCQEEMPPYLQQRGQAGFALQNLYPGMINYRISKGMTYSLHALDQHPQAGGCHKYIMDEDKLGDVYRLSIGHHLLRDWNCQQVCTTLRGSISSSAGAAAGLLPYTAQTDLSLKRLASIGCF